MILMSSKVLSLNLWFLIHLMMLMSAASRVDRSNDVGIAAEGLRNQSVTTDT